MFNRITAARKIENKFIERNKVKVAYQPNFEQHCPAAHPVTRQSLGAGVAEPQCSADVPQQPNFEQHCPAGQPTFKHPP